MVEPDFPVDAQDDKSAGAITAKPATTIEVKAPDHRRHNPLSEYSSQTYQIVLSMMTPEAYQTFVRTGRKSLNIDGVFLIAQSGGINNPTTVLGEKGSASRADGFGLDYYIDDLKITAVCDSAGTGAPVTNTEMSFNIIEPYGFSFVTKLKEANKQIAAASNTPGISDIKDPTKNLFVLGIRFLGYDKDGKVVESSKRIFDRYYDINITELKFRLDGRTVTYNIKAVTMANNIGAGTKRGIINHELTVTGRTIADVLTQAMTKLNNDQNPPAAEQNKTTASKQKNTYSVEFRGPGSDLIKNASIVSKADTNKAKTPMGITIASGPDTSQRTVTFKNGTPIIQAMGQLISQSSYLEDALPVVYKADTQPVNEQGKPEEIIPDTKKQVMWFNVTMEVTPKEWDTTLKDFMFDIKYVIQPYLTPMTLSPLIENTSKYYGPVKRYDYWYTGQNSEVLRFDQQFNTAYFSITLRPGDVAPDVSPISVASGQPQPQDKLGRPPGGTEAASSYITSLYDPTAWVQMKMDILGDPDWLLYDGAPSPVESEYSAFYGPDGYAINPTGGQVFIEINFYEAVDYENTTGTMLINNKLLLWDYPPEVLKENNVNGVCYRIILAQSTFNGGVFKQTLTGVLNPFNKTKTEPAEQRPAATKAPTTTVTPSVQGTAAADIRRTEIAIAQQSADDDAGAGAQAARQTVTDRMANSRFGRLSRNNAASNIDRNF